MGNIKELIIEHLKNSPIMTFSDLKEVYGEDMETLSRMIYGDDIKVIYNDFTGDVKVLSTINGRLLYSEEVIFFISSKRIIKREFVWDDSSGDLIIQRTDLSHHTFNSNNYNNNDTNSYTKIPDIKYTFNSYGFVNSISLINSLMITGIGVGINDILSFELNYVGHDIVVKFLMNGEVYVSDIKSSLMFFLKELIFLYKNINVDDDRVYTLSSIELLNGEFVGVNKYLDLFDMLYLNNILKEINWIVKK